MAFAKVLGNHGQAQESEAGRRSGRMSPNGNVNWVEVIGAADGDVAYIRASGFNSYDTKLSYFYQGDGSAGIQFTLVNEARACEADPTNQTAIADYWTASKTMDAAITAVVDANNIPIGFSVAKITFTKAGVVYLMGR